MGVRAVPDDDCVGVVDAGTGVVAVGVVAVARVVTGVGDGPASTVCVAVAWGTGVRVGRGVSATMVSVNWSGDESCSLTPSGTVICGLSVYVPAPRPSALITARIAVGLRF